MKKNHLLITFVFLLILFSFSTAQAREVFAVRLLGQIISEGIEEKNEFFSQWTTSDATPLYTDLGLCQGNDSPNPWCTCTPPEFGNGCSPEYSDYVAAHLLGGGAWRFVGCASRSNSSECTPYSSLEPYPENNYPISP